MIPIKTGILLALFGASSAQGITTLHAFEALVRQRCPNVAVRWAFTSTSLRKRLAHAKKKIDSVDKALQKMAFERFTHVAVQPLHVVPGLEYEDIAECVQQMRSKFMALHIGKPLLCTEEECDTVAAALCKCLPYERQAHETVLFMGHGSLHRRSSELYVALGNAMSRYDQQVFIGTMKGDVRLEHLLQKLHTLPQQTRSSRIWLMPLLALAGTHALEDMAGTHPSSWLSQLQHAGFQCQSVVHGLLEYEPMACIWAERLRHTVTHF